MATAAGGTHPTGMHSCTHGCIDLVLTRVLTLYLQGYRINTHRGTDLVLAGVLALYSPCACRGTDLVLATL